MARVLATPIRVVKAGRMREFAAETRDGVQVQAAATADQRRLTRGAGEGVIAGLFRRSVCHLFEGRRAQRLDPPSYPSALGYCEVVRARRLQQWPEVHRATILAYAFGLPTYVSLPES